MIDLTDFKKYKIIYLVVILSCVLLCAYRTAPLRNEVFVDIVVEPPQNVRQTDFSWITVNEWFVTQTRLIKSDNILQDVASALGKERIKKIISANRAGASNIIRISARSGDDPELLKALVGDIANAYLDLIAKPSKEIKEIVEPKKADQSDRKKILEGLRSDGAKVKGEIDVINRQIKDGETERAILDAKPSQSQEIKGRIAEIDKTILVLKIELANLKVTYTDNWPPVVSLKSRIDTLQGERQKLEGSLSAAQELDNKKADFSNRIVKYKKDAEALQEKTKAIDNRLAQAEQAGQEAVVKQEAAPKKDLPTSRIITVPTQSTQRIFPVLGIRLLIAAIIGVILWFLLGLILKNVYLFWVFKDRLFKKW